MSHAVLVFETIYVDQVWAAELEENINHVIDTLMDQVDRDPDDDDEDAQPLMETPSGEAFDGCEVCVRREIMVMTLTATVGAYEEGRAERRLVA